MSKPFQYSVLKYRPSYLLDERVNVGLLFHFVGDQRLVFVHPSSLKRISQSFPQLAKLSDIRRYLEAFARQAGKLTKNGFEASAKLEDIIGRGFLVNDANSFFFSEVKFGFYESLQETLDYYTNQYFHFYENDSLRPAHNDAFVRSRFENLLKEAAHSKGIKANLFQKGVTLDNKIGKTEFDYGWQNGTSNLVKTLGFDLSDDGYIQEKAFRWFGTVTHLKEFAREKDLRFDFLVAPPANRGLFEAYDHALEVLSSIEANKKIVEEKGIRDYVEDAVETARAFDVNF
jgi:Protein of unknown function (DUF3037)